MDVLIFKIFSSIIIFIVNLLFTYLPTLVSSTSWVSRAEALAGGIFIGAAICHLLPEAIHYYKDDNYPIPAIIVIISILFMWIIDKITKYFSDKQQEVEIETTKTKDKVCRFPQLSSMILYFLLLFHCFIEGVAFGVIYC